jgi:hypothetical protein
MYAWHHLKAKRLRQVADALGIQTKPPVRGGCTPSVFAQPSQLLERAFKSAVAPLNAFPQQYVGDNKSLKTCFQKLGKLAKAGG